MNEHDEIVEWLDAVTDVQDAIDVKVLLRNAHKDLAETLQALRASEAKSRTQAEQLRALSDELTTILNTAGIGITRCSRDLRFLRANETYATIAGLPLAQIIGRPIVEVIGETAFITIRPNVERVLAGERVEYESEIPLRNCAENCFCRVVYVPDRDPHGAIVGWIACVADITARKQAERALAERNAQLALAGRAALVGSYTYDVHKGTMQLSEGYAAIHGLPERTTETSYSEWRDRLHPEDLGRAEGLRNQAFAVRRKEDNAEYRIVLSTGEVRWIERRGSISYGVDGCPERVVGVNIDVTERKRAEQHQRALNAELDHRVKNVLATVSAIIAQTQEVSSSRVDFAARLNSRINSLARTHELLSEGNWRGVSLAEIIRREFAPYARGNTEERGPSVTLKAEATHAVAIVLHELTTNSAKYGALSSRSGRVAVRWWWLQNGSHARLAIEWQETGGPPVLAPSQSGYGTSVIRELIPFELGGAVQLAFAPEGTRCRLEIPGEWISRERGTSKETRVSDFAQTFSA
jgi:PAS domain S-box-containing protein